MKAIMRTVRDRRRDFHAQTACHIVDANALVVFEDLNTTGMTAAARGTAAEPGTHTSVTCPVCGHTHPDNRESQAKFACRVCGHLEHADTVAAKNTLARGHAGYRAWRPRRQPVCEAPTSVKPQGISAPTAEVGIPSASAVERIVKSVR